MTTATDPTIAQILEAARGALRGERRGPLVMDCARGEPVVAFLVTLGPVLLEQVVMPLVADANPIGSSSLLARRGQRWPEPRAVEGAQWVVTCGDGRATIRDAASTNLSAFVPRSVAQALDHDGGTWGYARDMDPDDLARAMDLSDPSRGSAQARPRLLRQFPAYEPLLQLPGVVLLPHPNDPPGEQSIPIDEGDVVCSCYAALAFGWLRA